MVTAMGSPTKENVHLLLLFAPHSFFTRAYPVYMLGRDNILLKILATSLIIWVAEYPPKHPFIIAICNWEGGCAPTDEQCCHLCLLLSSPFLRSLKSVMPYCFLVFFDLFGSDHNEMTSFCLLCFGLTGFPWPISEVELSCHVFFLFPLHINVMKGFCEGSIPPHHSTHMP